MRFFSQNDHLWKQEKLGQSACTCGQFGCTTCSIGMAGTYFGEEITPYYLTKRLRYTAAGLILWQSIGEVYKKMNFHWRFYVKKHGWKLCEGWINEGLKNPNKAVLLNVDRGYHWVMLLSKWPVLGYRCVDPYPYPHKVRYYKPSEVVGGAVMIRK